MVSRSEQLKWDQTQRQIIELDEAMHQIVEAGPGSGKTAVACARVAWLIDSCGLEASKILLISFTRTAVKELRNRIMTYASHPISVAGLQILTLDSYTWQILRGFNKEKSETLLESYEKNIEQLVTRLQDKDQNIREYLSEFQHVIFDESQDLIGKRADLSLQIIQNLPDDCGVTIFADSAQAIYGFTRDDENNNCEHSKSLAERINDSNFKSFEKRKLTEIYRTQDKSLISIFTQGRDCILNHDSIIMNSKQDPESADSTKIISDNIEHWKIVRKLIRETAHEQIDIIKKEQLDQFLFLEQSGETPLILFRTRLEVLNQSSFLWKDGILHKIRMSGAPVRIHPWIGRLFSEATGNHYTKEQFFHLWQTRIGATPPVHVPECEDAWELMRESVGNRQNQIQLPHLRKLLSQDKPPVDFILDESELPGPIVGTIHASKGREASVVYLMLKNEEYLDRFLQNPTDDAEEQIIEEARVLFVGATRAKDRLVVGKGQRRSAFVLENRRTYSKIKEKYKLPRRVEVGLPGDFDSGSVVRSNHCIPNLEQYGLQDWFWSQSNSHFPIKSKYHLEYKSSLLYLDEGEKSSKVIGALGPKFSSDLWTIAKTVGHSVKPPSEIQDIHMYGATTIVIPETERSLLSAPWSQSGFILSPYITGFAYVPFCYSSQKSNFKRKKK